MERLTSFQNRRGSALLIVLGMLSFMVISAVAFSAYMRFARLPSSFLRRSVASSMLAKAALARAIDEVDAAIGNNPHPGVGKNQYYYPRSTGTGSNKSIQMNRNHWKSRVYMGGEQGNSTRTPMVSQMDTVSPLCLEALAYLPPAIVNEVRYYSRHTQTAEWHEMDYDAGRYAFCAVDVSDYFDINAVHADVPRLSSAESRVSLAYLFESLDHDNSSPVAGMCTVKQWDDFMSEFRPNKVAADPTDTSGSKLPLISLADFNLALHSLGAGSLKSYFCQYVENNKTSYYGFNENSPEAEAVSRMMFVTDSWSVQTNTTSGVLNLSNDDDQPFDISDLTSGNKGWSSVMNETGKGANELVNLLCGLGRCELFDYLDKDSVPLSLAIPTHERTPMICGVDMNLRSGTLKVEGTGKLKGSPKWKDNNATTLKVECDYEASYTLSGLPNAPVSVLVTFPYRNQLSNDGAYEIGGRLSYFLSEANSPIRMRLGPKNNDILHLGADGSPLSVPGSQPFKNAVYSVELKGDCPQPSAFKNDGEESAVKIISLTPSKIPTKINYLQAEYKYYSADNVYKTEKQVEDYRNDNGGADPSCSPTYRTPDLPNVDPEVKVSNESCSFVPLTSEGELDSDFVGKLSVNLANKSFSKKLKLNVAVWIWIKDKNANKVVDLVPACFLDDQTVGGLPSSGSGKKGRGENIGGVYYPLMRFDMRTDNNDYVIDFKSQDAGTDKVAQSVDNNAAAIKVVPQSVYVGDPRFNHAPEHWFYVNKSANMSVSDWLENCGAHDSSRDGDIFMQTSDQGYMQSIYELSNLLWLKDRDASYTDEGMYQNPDDGRSEFKQGFSSARNAINMWRTYSPFAYRDGSAGGYDFENTKFVSALGGNRISPYSETNVLMAAFANTPLEWRFAADSDRTDGKVESAWDKCNSVTDFNQKYAWNEYSTNGKIKWDDLVDFSDDFYQDIRSNPNKDWRDIYDDLWQSNIRDSQKLGDIALQDTSEQGRLWNCDKKFLYGFWRESLAVQQQLFLIFVRAEPLMMGGGMAGAIPPSLGVKAMALVWRDPTATTTGTSDRPAPHRTRTLFYRQFE